MITHCDGNFLTLIQDNPIVLADFTATWCQPCKMQSKILEEFDEKHPDIAIVKVNIDDHPDLCNEMRINAVPTIIFFVNGQRKTIADGKRQIDAIVGLVSLKGLMRCIDIIKKDLA